MAIGGGVGRRHKKVIPPSTMALISAPASAEFQWIRPDEEARLGDGEEEGGVAGEVFEEGERAIDYSNLCRARASCPRVVKIMSSCMGWTMPPRTSR